MDHRQTVVVCEFDDVPDLCVVEALVRLQLVARRRRVRLQVHATGDLAGLLALTGLDVVLQPLGQTEAREQRCGVEEVVDVGDLSG